MIVEPDGIGSRAEECCKPEVSLGIRRDRKKKPSRARLGTERCGPPLARSTSHNSKTGQGIMVKAERVEFKAHNSSEMQNIIRMITQRSTTTKAIIEATILFT